MSKQGTLQGTPFAGGRIMQPVAFAMPYEVLTLSKPGTRVGVIRGVCAIPKGGITAVCGDLPVAIEVEHSDATILKILAGTVGVAAGAYARVDLTGVMAGAMAHLVSADLCHSARALACVPSAAPFFAIGAGRFGGSQWSKDHELGHLRGLWCHAMTKAGPGEPDACSPSDPVIPKDQQPTEVEWLGYWDGAELTFDRPEKMPEQFIIRHPGYAARAPFQRWRAQFEEAARRESDLRAGKRGHLAVYTKEGRQYGRLVHIAVERGTIVYVYRDVFGRLHTVLPAGLTIDVE
jgi:hypothetical protein